MTSSSKFTGKALGKGLELAKVSQSALARATGASQGYISGVISGNKLPSASWLDLMADTLEMTPAQRVELHRSAARDHGFKIDLT